MAGASREALPWRDRAPGAGTDPGRVRPGDDRRSRRKRRSRTRPFIEAYTRRSTVSGVPNPMKQVSLKSAAVEVDILPEVGARLHRLRAFGRDILRAPANPEEHIRDPFFWGGYPMAPGGGPVHAGPVQGPNRQRALPPNFPDRAAIP